MTPRIIRLDQVQPIVDAVLYEGYILYPYRSSATKNRQRWTFGGIYPKVYHEATGGAEPWQMQTQCLLEGGPGTRLEVLVRFLQPAARDVGELTEVLDVWPPEREPEFKPVAVLTLGERQFHSWQEAIERDVVIAASSPDALLATPVRQDFVFDRRRELDPLRDDAGQIRGVLLRTCAELRGRVELAAGAVVDGVLRISVRIENLTAMDPASVNSRDEAALYSFASTHTVLGVENGAFVSQTDPSEALKEAANDCENQGTWPVLVGRPGMRDTLLSSPIILQDYPAVAPESAGEMFDGTEIDEILSLNILAMTDEEKREMAATDPRAAALLARTEALNGDDLLRMHGVLREALPEPADPCERNPLEPESRGPRLAWYANGDTALKVGDHVRLRPKAGGDIWDLVLDGKPAVIEGIERDFEDRIHVAVALDDDPGREWGLQRMPGHRFFFSPEEIEPLPATVDREAQA